MAESTEQTVPVTFASFVVSLAQSAMVNLGEVSNPMTGQSEPNLMMARHTIDLLGLLHEKTKGNLDNDEEKLLDSVLYDLRLRFVNRKK